MVKEKQQPTKPPKMVEFEAYEEAKLKEWASHKRPYSDGYEGNKDVHIEDLRSEEQKAFETYANQMNSFIVAPFSGWHDPTANTAGSNVVSRPEYGTGTGNIADVKDGYYYVSSDYTKKGSLPTEIENLPSYFGIIEKITMGTSNKYKSSKIRETLTIASPVDQSGREFIRFKKDYTSAVFSEWEEINVGGSVPSFKQECLASAVVAEAPSATVTLNNVPDQPNTKQFSFEFGLPKAGDGGSGGGGGGTIKPPANKLVGQPIKGDFGLNLFDYREMSRDTNFKVNGKVFYIDNPRKMAKSKEEIDKLTPYNRIKEGQNGHAIQNITINAKLLETSDSKSISDSGSGNNKLEVIVHAGGLDGLSYKDLFKLQFPNNTSDRPDKIPTIENKKVDYQSNYSYLRFDMGGSATKESGRVLIEAYYGGIKPQGLTQKFEFKEYNGITLKKNLKGTSDEYLRQTWGDTLKLRLGLFNLKDAEFVTAKDGDTSSTIIIKKPKDMWLPVTYFQESTQPAEKTKVHDNLMTSNLCDISTIDDNADRQNKPFFVRKVFQEEVDGEAVDVLYILMAKEDRHKWREHLSQTQILYPICDPDSEVQIPLPLGGYTVTLTSGQSIDTNKYRTIESARITGLTTTKSIMFKDSPFGYPDYIIDINDIASVSLNVLKASDI